MRVEDDSFNEAKLFELEESIYERSYEEPFQAVRVGDESFSEIRAPRI